MSKLLKSNKGVSLVELLIVVSIMTVIGGALTFGIGMFAKKEATRCAKNVELSLDKNRTNAMGRNTAKVTFYRSATDNQIYVREEINYTAPDTDTSRTSVTTCIGKSNVKFLVGTSGTELDSSGVTIIFNRSDGSLKSAVVNTGSSTDVFPMKISLGSLSYEIKVDKLTGRVTINEM